MYNPWRELLVFGAVTVVLNALLTAIHDDDDPEIDYYVKLISEEIEKSNNYVLPEDASEYRGSDSEIKDYGTYDFVVIGSGSAGSVAAARLSEKEDNHVLVLEAGTFENDFIRIPAMSVYNQRSKYNWGYKSTPQTTACLGMVDRRCPYPRGKGFGGTSLLNFMLYSRGNQLDFDQWEKQGNPGWSFSDVLPYFIKSENCNVDVAHDGYHGTGGPVNVEYYNPSTPQLHAFIDANAELGRDVTDYNGRLGLAVSRSQLFTLNGKRHSSARAFLYPALRRKNLKLSAHSYVTKILINGETKTASGVEFMSNGTRYRVEVRKEVILSAGAIASPQILMLSGVGPEDHLKKLDIPVVQNLPVGRNLDDHPAFFGLNLLSNYSRPVQSLKQSVRNYLRRLGPLTVAGNAEGLAFVQTKLANIKGHPDVEVVVCTSHKRMPIGQQMLRFTDESERALRGDIDGASAFTIIVVLLHPLSKGTLELNSSDPFDYPLIDSRFLSDPEDRDIETMYQGIRLVLDMLDTEAFKGMNASLGRVVHPNCKSLEYLSREFWYCTIRHFTLNAFHPIAACKMGPDPRDGAVVDSKLRVHGIKNLRVADTSVIPFSLSGHPNAVANMIGERVADFIAQR